MPKGFKAKDNATKRVLLFIAASLGALALASSIGSSRKSHILLKELLRTLDERAQRALRELRRRKLLALKEHSDGSTTVEITHFGRKIIHRYELEDMRLKKPKRWDGKWRIITYDIPVAKKKASQALARKLHQLGLYQFQRSFWISPYECLSELEFICAIFELEIDRHIFYFTTDAIPKKKEIMKFFEL